MKRPRPMRTLLRFVDRVILGPVMSAGAFIIERRVVRAMKAAPPKGANDMRATGGEPDQPRPQG